MRAHFYPIAIECYRSLKNQRQEGDYQKVLVLAAWGDFGWHGTHRDLRGKDRGSHGHLSDLHMRSTCTLHTTERSIRPSASMWMLSAVRRARLMYPAFYSFPVNDCLFLNLPTLETFRGTQDQGQFIRLNWV